MLEKYKARSKVIEQYKLKQEGAQENDVRLLVEEELSVKKYMSFSLYNLCKKALTNLDKRTIKELVDDLEIDFTQA